jgi:acyl-[acyl-carrier-protein] desaturase
MPPKYQIFKYDLHKKRSITGVFMELAYPIEISPSYLEVLNSIEAFVRGQVTSLLKPVAESWQPSDFLPDMASENWADSISKFRERAKALPDDLLVVLVGDMITEEALPSYQSWLNRLKGVIDYSGADESGWALWSRGWTAEENRHGDLLNKYLYLTGRVNMRSVETTIHHLITNGFNPQTENNPYLGFIYTSFQERATKISHRNVATLAAKAGEDHLQKICGMIAGDEARHEKAYKLFMTKIFEVDPVNALQAFAKMLKTKIVMPASLMHDGNDEHLFAKFSNVAQRIGVYTAYDYAEIIEDLVSHWNISGMTSLSGVASKAQDYICSLSDRYKKLADRIKFPPKEKFSWIYDREA